jgi:hypothetical protein
MISESAPLECAGDDGRPKAIRRAARLIGQIAETGARRLLLGRPLSAHLADRTNA